MEQAELVDELRDWLVRQRQWALERDPAMAGRLAFWIQACRDASTRLENAGAGTRRSAAMDVDVLLDKAFTFAMANAAAGAPARRWSTSRHEERELMVESSRFSRLGAEANPN